MLPPGKRFIISPMSKYRFEVILMYLFDVGRSIDVRNLANLFIGRRENLAATTVGRRSDTPASLVLPKPLIINLDQKEQVVDESGHVIFNKVQFVAKMYEEGVVTVVCRAELTTKLKELHTLRYRCILLDGQETNLDAAAHRHFEKLLNTIQPFINQDQYTFDAANEEDYHVFCLLDKVDDPQKLLDENRNYLAPFLLGETPSINLHESQIASTMKTPFSFTEDDIAIFDMDRSFLIAPNRDYEDLLLIIEHANYQLLELRVLDSLLDKLLDDAERDVRARSKSSWRGNRSKTPSTLKLRSLSQKLENLQPLRLDALFILENLENSSKIIGDYYLEQIYEHLCGIFNTQGWKGNVERRLEILQSIYSLTKKEKTDSTMVILELLVVVMIGIELIALIFPLVKN